MADQQLVDRLTSIQGIRPATAESVADAYASADQLAEATADELTEIKGIGAVTAARIVEEFSGPAAAPSSTDEGTTAPVASLDDHRDQRPDEPADDPVEQIRVAARAITDGATAVVDTVRDHLPEIKDSFGKAAGSVVDLGREVKNVVLRRAS